MRDSDLTFQSLEEIGRGGLFVDGDWVESKDQDPSGEVRLTQLADVGVGTWRDRSDRWLREDQARQLRCTFLEPGDLLIARMPDPLGRACLVPASIGRAVTVVDVAILRLGRSDVDRQYVMHMINAPQFQQSVAALQSGTTRKRISRKNLAGLKLPLPTLDKQQALVEILEGHLSRLDAAGDVLRAVRLRARALEAAVRDELHAAGDRRTLSQVAAIQGGIQKQPKRRPADNAYPFLRVANVTAQGLRLDEVHRVELFDGELERLRLQGGDLLVVEGNGSASQIGRACLWQDAIPDCVHQNHIIRVRPVAELLPGYLEAVWNSPTTRRELSRLASSSSGLHTLSVGKLSALSIPVPSLAEQAVALARVSAFRSRSERLAAAVDSAALRLVVLRRALLAAAFSGELTSSGSTAKIKEMPDV